jgi:probable F420-dependent oxidoreductase
MKVGVLLPIDSAFTVAAHTRFAQAAEAGGLDSVYVGEVAGYEPFVLLAAIGARIPRIRLGTAIASIYSRPPALMAAQLLALASLVGSSRVVAGLGTSSPIMVEYWQGLRFDKPVARMREYVALLRTMFAGDKTSFEGTTLRSHGFKTTVAPCALPIYLGAFGPRMARLAGECADGVIAALTPPAQLGQVLDVARSARPDGLAPLATVVSGLRVYCGPDTDTARAFLRRLLLGYAMVPTHRRQFEPYVPHLADVEDLWRRGDRAGAMRAFGDSAVDTFCVVGPPGAVAGRIREYASAGVDELLLQPVGRDVHDRSGCLRTIESVAAARPLS